MRYSFLPLEQHCDFGYGAHAESFEQGAKVIERHIGELHEGRQVLNFLYRHAVELYLKSMIVVLHRFLRLSYPESASEPTIMIQGKPRLLRQTHNIKDLLDYFLAASTANANALGSWSEMPEEYKTWIYEIDKADPSSTYYRYPSVGKAAADLQKSAWRESSEEELLKIGEQRSLKTLLITDDTGAILEAYVHDPRVDNRMTETLQKAVSAFSSAHLGMRAELMDGY